MRAGGQAARPIGRQESETTTLWKMDLKMQTLIPHHIDERQSDDRGIKAGWYAMRRDGTPRFGPFATRGECLVGIARFKDLPEPVLDRPGAY
jgi:hypothetical protein